MLNRDPLNRRPLSSPSNKAALAALVRAGASTSAALSRRNWVTGTALARSGLSASLPTPLVLIYWVYGRGVPVIRRALTWGAVKTAGLTWGAVRDSGRTWGQLRRS